MLRLFAGVAPYLHLSRVTTAFAAVANVWFVILWTRARPEEPAHEALTRLPVWICLLAGAAVATGLYTLGAALNDLLDVRRDKALHPERPLPSGRLRVEGAVGLVALAVMVAVLGATAFGIPAVLLTLLTAGAILFFNAAARFVPSVGLVSLALIYGAHMIIPNIRLVFIWPVFLVMSHAMGVAALTHLLGQRRPRLTRTSVFFAALGWAFWSGVLIWVGWRRAGGLWPDWAPLTSLIGPAVLVAIFAVLGARKIATAKSGPKAAEKIARYGALWLALYATAWMLGAGELFGAAVLGALALIGFLGMTLLRELYGLIEKPIGYRR